MSVADEPHAVPGHDLSLYLRALDVGLWNYDIDTDSLSCDPRWYAMLMVKPGSVRRVADFKAYIHPEDADFATAVDLDAVQGLIEHDGRYHIDYRIIRPDGATRWWRSVACLVVCDRSGHRHAVGCVTDLTATPLIHRRADGTEPAPDDPRTVAGLTGRELECLHWVSIGKTAWETAMIMGRSSRTIEFHLTNAVRKLSASNKIHAAVIAVRAGLI